MSNKQKLFENLASLGMILVLAGLIAAAILPMWRSYDTCTNAWFSINCNGQPSSRTRGEIEGIIYNATYSLIVIAAVLLAVLIIVFAMYVWGSRTSRWVPGHVIVALVIATAVTTFAVGLPNALSRDNNGPVEPFFSSSAGSPAIGWYIALAASILEGIVFILLFFAYR